MNATRLKLWTAAWVLGVAIGAFGGSRAHASDFDGSWATACITSNGQYMKQDLYVTDYDIFSTIDIYSEPGCFNLKLQLQDHYVYTISGASPSLSGAELVDMTEQRSFITVLDASIADQWSVGHFCSLANWNVGIPLEVTGLQCGDHQVPKTGDMSYDLYLYDPRGKLYLGQRTSDLDGSKPEKRPHDVNRGLVFQPLGS